MLKAVTFNERWIAYLLVAPQLAITFVFFIWPASQALWTSTQREDAFGFSREFVGAANFERLFNDPVYLDSVVTTLWFSAAVTFSVMFFGLLLAAMADRIVRGITAYRTFLIWPYAVAPAVAGILWFFLFHPTVGSIAYALGGLGFNWNHYLNGNHAFVLVVVAASWKQIAYAFLFFLAAMQSIPKSLIEAAAIDGAGPWRRFITIVLPLIAPTTFFLLVVTLVYSFFDTFPIIDAITSGGPARATDILVYKVFRDGFEGLDLGGSAAQSVILMAMVAALTVVQFRYIERRVQYQ